MLSFARVPRSLIWVNSRVRAHSLMRYSRGRTDRLLFLNSCHQVLVQNSILHRMKFGYTQRHWMLMNRARGGPSSKGFSCMNVFIGSDTIRMTVGITHTLI